jgi:hypothetical protein
MQVKMTQVLRKSLESQGLNADKLLEDFATWRAGDEFGHPFFGKDSAYGSPKVDGQKNVLRHVHLVPLNDLDSLEKWKKDDSRGSRKKSDRVLVYVSDGTKKHLLIFILDDPGAHAIADMQNQADRETMLGFAEVAAEFLDTGEILT